ncbi:hypothetical protein AMELA_G00244220 [Ameiurus melas]|uniref:Uncharacterized protein n=1 Tax=Ameiurus melas TaxID=219545 RepID=A0A7J5ZUC0_AMEME|nr:hypothetical protein AMELA_G00244220 [Ameiurus melas]
MVGSSCSSVVAVLGSSVCCYPVARSQESLSSDQLKTSQLFWNWGCNLLIHLRGMMSWMVLCFT